MYLDWIQAKFYVRGVGRKSKLVIVIAGIAGISWNEISQEEIDELYSEEDNVDIEQFDFVDFLKGIDKEEMSKTFRCEELSRSKIEEWRFKKGVSSSVQQRGVV